MTTQNIASLRPTLATDTLAVERAITLSACQERLLLRNEDVAILKDFEVGEALDDCEGVVVPVARVRRHMTQLATERPDLVARVRGRWAWVVRLAGWPEVG